MANQGQAQQEEKLQAILILESYTNNFKPFSIDRAECLMPMVGGKTLLDHNLQFLVDNEVEEIYLFCTKHHKQIKDHLDEKRWKERVELHFLYSLDCQSLGDAIREIDGKGLIRSNFIMLTCTGIISNLKLKEHLEKHRQTAKTDRNAIMTVLCLDKQSDFKGSSHTNKSHTGVLIMHNESNRILHYDHVNMLDCKKNSSKYVEIPGEFLDMVIKDTTSKTSSAIESANAKLLLSSESPMLKLAQGIDGSRYQKDKLVRAVQTRTNLVETQIYLCSPYVLHMFTDNFDFQNMKEFIRGVLVDQDVTGYTIYIDTVKRKFGTHFSLVSDLNSYYLETMRLLQRADLILRPKERADYSRMMDKLSVFVHKKSLRSGDESNFNSNATERNVFVDANCYVGENAALTNCYLGANVRLGKNVKLANCVVLPNTVICDGASANGCLFGYNVRVGVDCDLCENVLFSNNCKVKNGTAIKQRACFIAPNTKFEPGQRAETDHKKSKAKAHLENVDSHLETLSKGVSEENYSVYILSDRYDENDNEDEADDDFGDSDGENHLESEQVREESDSDESDEDAGALDTSKNGHFLVLKALKSARLSSSSSEETTKGKQPKGKQPNEDEYEESFNNNEPRGYESLDELESSEYSESSEDDDDDDSADEGEVSEAESGSEDEESDAHGDSNKGEDVQVFFTEVVEILQRGLDKNLTCDNLVLEINSCKHAYYIPIDDVCFYLARAVFRLPLIARKGVTSPPPASQGVKTDADYLQTVKWQSKKFLQLLENYYATSKQSQAMFLDSLLDFVVNEKPIVNANLSQVDLVENVYVKMLHFFFNELGFLQEDSILGWYEKQKQSLGNGGAPEKKVKAIGKLKPFIDWLQDDDDEEDEEDDE